MKNIHIILLGILFLGICLINTGCGSSNSNSYNGVTPEEQEVIDIATGYFGKFCNSKEDVLSQTSESFTYIYGSVYPEHGNYSNYSTRLGEFFNSYIMTECVLEDAAAISCDSESARVGGRLIYKYHQAGSEEIIANSEEIEAGLVKESSVWVVNYISGRNNRGIDFPFNGSL